MVRDRSFRRLLGRLAVAGVGVGLLLVLAARPALATTWRARSIACGVCGTTNDLDRPASYGSYIYQWPSRFQLIFWPATDDRSLHHCKSCKLTVFMEDFEKVPAEKLDAVKKALEGFAEVEAAERYTAVPVLKRLEIAEKVYEALGAWDDDRWCWFYRVLAHHAEKQKDAERAKAAQKKALALAKKLLGDDARSGQAREHQVIAGSMHAALDEKDEALAAFDAASKLSWTSPDGDEKATEGFNAYLDQLIADWKAKLGS